MGAVPGNWDAASTYFEVIRSLSSMATSLQLITAGRVKSRSYYILPVEGSRSIFPMFQSFRNEDKSLLVDEGCGLSSEVCMANR